jgi:hypothetical protein
MNGTIMGCKIEKRNAKAKPLFFFSHPSYTFSVAKKKLETMGNVLFDMTI